jgi:hypothetical protein
MVGWWMLAADKGLEMASIPPFDWVLPRWLVVGLQRSRFERTDCRCFELVTAWLLPMTTDPTQGGLRTWL